jgi:hypothetical protein
VRPFHSALVLMGSRIGLRPLVTIACANTIGDVAAGLGFGSLDRIKGWAAPH